MTGYRASIGEKSHSAQNPLIGLLTGRIVGKPETETGLVADFRVAHHPLAIASGIDEPPVAGIALAEAQRI